MVCGLPAQHQPSFGRLSLIRSAVTRRSPQREASREKPPFLATASGSWVTSAMPSSMVSGERPASRMLARASSGVTLSVSAPVSGAVSR